MNINRNNYEVYMIDYLDGKLDALEVSELLLFIEQNPDIKKEFEQLNDIPVIPLTKEEGLDKSMLKKPSFAEIKSHYQEPLVASLEGDLSIYEQYELERAFIVYPQLKTEAALYAQTRFQPDLSIVFPHKRQLKRKGILITLNVQYVWRVAAVFIAFALIVFLIRVPKQDENTLADTSTNHASSTLNGGKGRIAASQTKDGLDQNKGALIPLTTAQKSASDHISTESNINVEENRNTTIRTIERIEPKPSINENILASNKALPVSVNQYLPYSAPQKMEEEPYKALAQLANERATEGVLVEQNKPDSISDKPAISNIGLLLVKLYNKATGDSAKVVRKYDNDGNLTRVTIIADNFEFSRRR